MIEKKYLEEYIHKNIPLTQSIGITIEAASTQRVVLAAPFLPNINHKKTVFGGSLHALATMACWSLLHLNLNELAPNEIVITQSNVAYLFPVTGDFKAECALPEDLVWKRFLAALQSKGKGRVELEAKIFQGDKLAVDYKGTFAAIRGTRN